MSLLHQFCYAVYRKFHFITCLYFESKIGCLNREGNTFLSLEGVQVNFGLKVWFCKKQIYRNVPMINFIVIVVTVTVAIAIAI